MIDGEMQQKVVTKTNFLQFNNKRFYFSDGITLLPLSHPYFKDLNECKEKKDKGLKNIFGKKNIICLQ